MKSLHKESDIQEQAASWLTELDSAGPRKRAQCLAWLKESPAHVKEFLLMTAMWEGLSDIDSQRRMNVDQLLTEATATVVPLQADERRSRTSHRRWNVGWRWYVAADAALIIAVALWIPQVYNGLHTYATTVGEQRSVKLADGSVVHLNTNSRIVVSFNDARRSIILMQGEALFTAARDATRPFRVSTGGVVIRALGTQFNVYRREDGVTVSVLEGSVSVSSQPGGTVAAGEQIDIADNGGLAKVAQPDLDKAIAWRQRQLIFRGDTLESVAAEVNRYNEAVQIRIEGAAARQRRMIGVFAADDPESLIQFLEKEGDLAIERRGAQILIRSR